MKTLLHVTMAVLVPVTLVSAAMERTTPVEGTSRTKAGQKTSGEHRAAVAAPAAQVDAKKALPANVLAVIQTGEHRYTVTDSAEIAFHTISRSAHTAYRAAPWARPGCHVMRSTKDWTAPGYVDYQHEMLIAVSLGSQDHLSATVEITDVKIGQDSVEVVYATNMTANPKQTKTHPHHLIRLPRADLPIRFQGPELVPPYAAR